jgi:hypothetical protein
MPEPQPPKGALNEDEKAHLDQVLGWANEALTEGEAFIKSQVGYSNISTCIDYIMGDYSRDLTPGSFSKIIDNRFGKIAPYSANVRRGRQYDRLSGSHGGRWFRRRVGT